MDLWNDYEGKTIAESFPLERLLYPEGRNGFFSTSNGTGTPAIIRLTESLNDQQEMLEQWSIVRGLNHPNLILIKKYGHTVVDDTPLVYAVMEPSDASLAEMLRERAMTAEETTQIATSITAALQALHSAGLVHGHIDPFSVFAVGESVKLRSDCAFKRPDAVDTAMLQAQDVKDLAGLLHQSLTLSRDRQPAVDLQLPAPLDQVIRNGLRGSWGLKEIAEALKPGAKAPAMAARPAARVQEAAVPKPSAPVASATIAARTEKAAIDSRQNELPLDFAASPVAAAPAWLSGPVPYIGIAAVLLLCILGWYFLHPMTQEQKDLAHSKTPTAAAQGSPVASLAAEDPEDVPKPAASTAAPVQAPRAVPVPVETRPVAASDRDVWRVVVFTYNQENQARKKVADITRHHQSMHPGVFTPSGQAPYLVTLGGPMSHDEASALQKKARSQGLPRDTYVQNYTAR